MEPCIVVICGIKNSGKTTLMAKLIRLLTEKKYRVAAVKHDGHDFLPDVPGTDSFRMREAGAAATAVFSGNRYLLYREAKDAKIEELAPQLGENDIILIEGMKHSAYPKLEIIREGIACEPSSTEEGRLAFVSDISGFSYKGYPVLNLNEPREIADYIIERFLKYPKEREDNENI